MDFDSLPVFDLLAKAGFREIQDFALGTWGNPVQNTCKGKTRKDFMFLSPEMQTLLRSIEISHDVWPDHSVLLGLFHNPNKLPPQWRWPTPAAFPWPKHFADMVQWQCDDGMPTHAYASLWSQIEKSACDNMPFPVSNRMCGRAQATKPALKPQVSFAPVKKPRVGDFQHRFFGPSVKYAQWVRQVRRLQHFHRLSRAVAPPAGQLAEVWGSILRAKGFVPSFPIRWTTCGFRASFAPDDCPVYPPDPLIAEAMFESVLMATRAFETELKKQSRHYARFRREQNPNIIFQDIRPPSAPGVDILLQPFRAAVVELDAEENKIVLEQDCPFSMEAPICCGGKPLAVIHHELDCLWVESLDGIHIGDVVSQTKPVGSHADLSHEFTKVWRERWMRHLEVPATRWNVIAQFARDKLPPGNHNWQSLCPDSLMNCIKGKKPSTSGGADGVSRQDLLAMSIPVMQAFCDMFKTAEQKGVWPQQLVEGKVVCLAKVAQPAGAHDFRPITIFGLLYRCWSTWHAKATLQALEDTLPEGLFGNRPGHYAAQVWSKLLWTIEVSFMDQIALSGLIADLQKAFNVLPRIATFEIASHVGMPGHVLLGWAAALTQMQRRFDIQGSLSEGVGSVTGFPEGCALSCIAMLLIDITFHAWMRAFFPLCQAITYVDDWQVVCCHPDLIAGAKLCLDRFVQAVDMQIDSRKTFAWSIDAEGRTKLRTQGFNVKLGARNLGAHVQFARKHTNATLQDRVQSMGPLWTRLKMSACSYQTKLKAIKVAGWPRALHAVSAVTLADASFQSLRAGAMRALSADGAGCNAHLHLGLVEDPSCDPLWWAVMQTLRFVRECGHKGYTQHALSSLASGTNHAPSNCITNTLLTRLQVLGWHVRTDGQLVDELSVFSLFDSGMAELSMRARWAWQKVVQREVAHRPSLQHVAYVDAPDTRKWLRTLPLCDRELMKKCLNGAHITQDCKQHCQDEGSPICPFCTCSDSRFHRFWICEHFASCRTDVPEGVLKLLPTLPETLSCFGWTLQPYTLQSWYCRLAEVQVPPILPLSSCLYDLHFFTDGSCLNQSDNKCRVASWAVVLASLHDHQDSEVVDSGPMPGLLQGSYRAEVFAIMRALSLATYARGKIFLWTDCNAVVVRLRRLLRGGGVRPNCAHSDLWMNIFDALQNFVPGQVVITKVAAHQKLSAARNPLQEWCFQHNGFADAAAAQAHYMRPQEFWDFYAKHVAAIISARELARTVQTVLLKVSQAAMADSKDFAEETADQLCEPSQVPPGTWQPLQEFSVPSAAVRWYSDEVVRTLLSWYWGQTYESRFPLIWVSQFQLYLDFCMTGELGPTHLAGWLPGRLTPHCDLIGISFKVRSRWFIRVLRESLKHQGSGSAYSFCRPQSRALLFHTGCLAVPWDPARIDHIDSWLLKFFPGGLRRISKGMESLPLTGRDARFTQVWISTSC